MPVTVKDLLDAANAAVPKVTPEEARALMAQGALVVDVRDGTEVAATGKVKGAVHAQRGLIEFKADSSLPSHDPAFQKDRVVIVYCASGGRSALAGKTLKDMGFADVRNLGGFKDWVESGGEIERS